MLNIEDEEIKRYQTNYIIIAKGLAISAYVYIKIHE